MKPKIKYFCSVVPKGDHFYAQVYSYDGYKNIVWTSTIGYPSHDLAYSRAEEYCLDNNIPWQK